MKFDQELDQKVAFLESMTSTDPLKEYSEAIGWVQRHTDKIEACSPILELAIASLEKEVHRKDQRYISLYLKLALTLPSPLSLYKYMIENRIGLESRDFYLQYVAFEEGRGRYEKADLVFKWGLGKGVSGLKRDHSLFTSRWESFKASGVVPKTNPNEGKVKMIAKNCYREDKEFSFEENRAESLEEINDSPKAAIQDLFKMFDADGIEEESRDLRDYEFEETISGKVFKREKVKVGVFIDEEPLDPLASRASILKTVKVPDSANVSFKGLDTSIKTELESGILGLKRVKQIGQDVFVVGKKVIKTNVSLWEYYISYKLSLTGLAIGHPSKLDVYSNYGVSEEEILPPSLVSMNLDEQQVAFYALEITKVIIQLHTALIIHGDLRLSVFHPTTAGLIITDFSSAIDLSPYSLEQTFILKASNNSMECKEWRLGLPFRFEPDYFGIAACVNQMMFGEEIVPLENVKDGYNAAWGQILDSTLKGDLTRVITLLTALKASL